MDTKTFLLASVAGGVVLFVLGGLIYGLALGSFVMENSPVVNATDPVWWAQILAQLVMGGFVTYIFTLGSGVSTFAAGMKGGAIIGLFIGVGIGFDLYAMGIETLTLAVVDTVLWPLRFAIAGGVIGQMLGKGRS